MPTPRMICATLSVALLNLCTATLARADVITLVGTRDSSGAVSIAPNLARCGPPPNVLNTLPTGVGASNVGAFTSSESHCVNPLGGSTHNLFNGLFAFDFGGGDSLFGTYTGTIVGVPPFPIPPGTVVDVSFAYTVTGGTGLFTEAGGSLLGIGTTTFTPTGPSAHLDITGTVSPIPEPGTLVLLGTGLAGIVARARGRRSGTIGRGGASGIRQQPRGDSEWWTGRGGRAAA